jgi:antibiotic biosynthesis monooxygenase (ABM) superfamily enzyme
MIVTVFRSRLRPGVREEYVALVEKIAAIAKTMPGYISHKGFFADDGERVTIVEFEHEEGMRAWRTEYHVQVCRLDRESKFKAKDTAAAQA